MSADLIVEVHKILQQGGYVSVGLKDSYGLTGYKIGNDENECNSYLFSGALILVLRLTRSLTLVDVNTFCRPVARRAASALNLIKTC